MVILGGWGFLMSEVLWSTNLAVVHKPSSFLLLSILELSDTQVYEPCIRTLLRTASHFCDVDVLKLANVDGSGTNSSTFEECIIIFAANSTPL